MTWSPCDDNLAPMASSLMSASYRDRVPEGFLSLKVFLVTVPSHETPLLSLLSSSPQPPILLVLAPSRSEESGKNPQKKRRRPKRMSNERDSLSKASWPQLPAAMDGQTRAARASVH